LGVPFAHRLSVDFGDDTDRSGGSYRSVREFDGVIDTYLSGPSNQFKVGDPSAQAALRIYGLWRTWETLAGL
jgi:hypothetical protein